MNKTKSVYVGGYIRISTGEERQRYSLSAQEDAIRKYIRSRRKEGYRLFRIYSDQKSAASLDRPALQNLLEDAERSLFDVILVVKLDRLCRRLADQLYLTEQFQKWGKKLEAVDEDIDLETPDGNTWTQIRGAFNEAERRKISYRLYVVKRMGARSIAVYLNQQSFRTRNGSFFSTSLVLAIITNPFYAGKIRWGGEIFPGKQEPLVDEKTFRKAQAILSERRGNPSLRRSNSSIYPLSGLLRCQRCGRHLVGVSAHGRGKVYQYYACPGKFKYGECELENLPRERIEASILSQVKKIFEDSQLITRILQRVNIKRKEKLPKKQAELRSIERQISDKRGILRKYLSAFESGALRARRLNERVQEIEDEIALLEEGKSSLEEEIARSRIQPITVGDLGEVIRKLEKVVLSARPSERKAFLRNMIKTIKVHSPYYIEPYYRIPLVRIMSGVAPRAGLEPRGYYVKLMVSSIFMMSFFNLAMGGRVKISMQGAIHSVLIKEKTASDALEEAATKISSLLKE